MPRQQETPAREIAGTLCDSLAGLSPFPSFAAHFGTDWVAKLARAPLGGGRL